MIRLVFPVLCVVGTHTQNKLLQRARVRLIITVQQRDLISSTFLGV